MQGSCVSNPWKKSHTQCTSLNLLPFPLLQFITAGPFQQNTPTCSNQPLQPLAQSSNPLPFHYYTQLWQSEAWSVFLWFSFGSASFFSPKATQTKTAPPTASLFISLFCYQPSIFYPEFVLPSLQPLISIIFKSSAHSI